MARQLPNYAFILLRTRIVSFTLRFL